MAGYLRTFFQAVERTWLPVGDAVRQAAARALAGLGRVAAEGRAAIRQVAAEVAAKAKPLLSKIEQEGERAAGTTNATVEQQAEAAGRSPEPEGPGGSGRVARAFTPAQREMVDEMRRAGVKFDEAKLLDVRRMPDGEIVYLEEGNARAGLQHILRHAGEFSDVGIAPE